MPVESTDSAQGDEALRALHALKERYRYMFTSMGPRLGQDFYRGWLPDLIMVCDAIDRLLGDDKRGFHFTQLKEKLGWARYYWRTEKVRPLRLSLFTGTGVIERQHGLENGDEVDNQIAQILLTAEASSRLKCIVCAEPAEVHPFGGWLVCTCTLHGPDAMSREDLLRACLLREAVD